MKKNFFIYSLLEKNINDSVNEMNEIIAHIEDNLTDIMLKSIFSYGVSHFENILTLIVKEIYNSFPERISSKSIQVTKEQITNDEDIHNIFVDNAIKNITYKDLKTFLEKYSSITYTGVIEEEKINQLIEIKETRNLIIHNNLKINSTYLSRCADNEFSRADAKDIGKSLSLDKNYVRDSLTICRDVVTNIMIPSLQNKYQNYTQKKAMEIVWNKLFQSLVLQFNDFWEFDNHENLRFCLKPYVQPRFSTTEQILFAKILIHFSGRAKYGYEDENNEIVYEKEVPSSMFNVKYMYGSRKESYLYLENVLRNNPNLFSGEF